MRSRVNLKIVSKTTIYKVFQTIGWWWYHDDVILEEEFQSHFGKIEELVHLVNATQ